LRASSLFGRGSEFCEFEADGEGIEPASAVIRVLHE